jgi:hypothetical protein
LRVQHNISDNRCQSGSNNVRPSEVVFIAHNSNCSPWKEIQRPELTKASTIHIPTIVAIHPATKIGTCSSCACAAVNPVVKCKKIFTWEGLRGWHPIDSR